MTVKHDHPGLEDLLDVAEGKAARGVVGEHLVRCASCRDTVEGLRRTAATARDWQLPDVTPLVWQHLPGRVRRAIDEAAAAPSWSPWRWRPAVATGLVALIVAIAAVVVYLDRAGQDSGGVRQTLAQGALEPVAAIGPAEPTALLGDEDDPAWMLLRQAGADLEWDAVAATISVPPGAAERAAAELSPEEQAELARLLHAEIDGGM